MKVERNCKNCNNLFEVKDHPERAGTGLFCSMKCFRDFKHLHKKRVIVKCIGCNKSFQQTITNQKYCDIKCYYKHDKRYRGDGGNFGKGYIATEETKNKLREIAKKQWVMGQFDEALKSKRERWKGTKNRMREYLHSLSKYKDWRSRIFNRDNYTCQRCFGKNVELHAHHIITFKEIAIKYDFQSHLDAERCEELFDAANGITLCLDCHKQVHKEMKLENA